ncbi:MAG: AlpA family phage regulatory protein [Polaromonas sp.]|nr:AlpA family phage regulatory protein [Polaromonas sp.]
MELLLRQGVFPKPRRVSPARVVWLVRELTDWMESRPVSELLPPRNTGAAKPRPALV